MQHTPRNLKRTALHNALGLALTSASMSANALLTTTTVLAFDPGVVGAAISPAAIGPSWFSTEVSPFVTIYTGIQTGQDGGIHIGVTQDTNGHASHIGTEIDGTPLHSGVGGIDDEWGFYYNAGFHFTTIAVTVVSDFGATKTLDFSGWNVTWRGIPTINMGGGIQDCGTASDGKCVDNANNDLFGTFDNGTGLATITCSSSSCSVTSTFILSYNARVPQADPSGFGGTPYGVHLEGHIGTTTTTSAPTTTAAASTTTTAASTTTTVAATTTTTLPPDDDIDDTDDSDSDRDSDTDDTGDTDDTDDSDSDRDSDSDEPVDPSGNRHIAIKS